MSKSIVVVGLGEMGSVFARGFLRLAYTVHPVIRGVEMQTVADEIADPELVLIAVGEADLAQQLAKVPDAWKDKLVLLPAINVCTSPNDIYWPDIAYIEFLICAGFLQVVADF